MSSPRFVLLHGGGHGGWCWSRVIPYLDAPALAVDVPARAAPVEQVRRVTFEDIVSSIVARIPPEGSEEIILVGHSAAGLLMPAITGRIFERLRHLVFVSCLIPADGGTALDHHAGLLRVFAPFLRHKFRRSGVMKLPAWIARRILCHDLDRETAKLVMERQCFEPASLALEPVLTGALSGFRPKTYVKLLRDRALPPALQDRFARNAGAIRVVSLDAGHEAMLSRPRELADILNWIASGAANEGSGGRHGKHFASRT